MADPDRSARRAEYTDHDRARLVAEDHRRPDRSEFARDRARVLHCSALRRLAGKTQVLVAGESDVPRTRLTHSLEVAQVAREVGESLGCDPDVVDVAGLAHDLGHPPFGHNGESVLDELAAACGGFEGNAQTFRVLTRLEAKVLDGEAASAGLNLTRASLDAASKYPWPREHGEGRYASEGGKGKYGVYDDDVTVFEWMRKGSPGERVCLEAQVMDWADDVAYSVHDVDDAIVLGLLQLEQLRAPAERAQVIEQCRAWYLPGEDPAALDAALRRLESLDTWVERFDGSMRALAAVKRMTSALIGRFCLAAQEATRQRFGPHPLNRYRADLVVPDGVRREVAVMKAAAATFVMLRPGAQDTYTRQRQMLGEVFVALQQRDGRDLEPWLRSAWATAGSDAERTRVIADQVASLTDVSLVRWHRRLVR